MKKILISIIVLALSASAMAIVIPDVVGISFETNNGSNKAQSHWYEATDGDDTQFQPGDATVINLPAGDGVSDQIFIYNQASYGNMASLYTPQLAGKYITIRTNNTETNYKFVFTALYPDNKEVKIVDHEIDSIFTVVKEASYSFTAPAGRTISNRFQFLEPFSGDEGELEVCHFGDNLEIRNNPYTTNIVVKNEAGEVVLNKMPFATPQFISLESLDAGRYTVEFNGGEKKYIIAVKPEVETETPVVP